MTTMDLTATVDGATLLARSLKQQGVDYIFGVVGFPITAFAAAAQREGITYIGMRNEQAASYAAQAAGYLTGRPQACAVVSGPGVIHALAGLANAQQNCWPMLLLGGASAMYHDGMGAFQEEKQVQAAHQFCKYAQRVEAPEEDVEAALAALRSASNPLVIVGKGMAWARAEGEVREFIEKTRLPFLATPMVKGVVPDDHPLSVATARTYALQNADVVLLLGARLNWILHFGMAPRYRPDL